MNNSNENLSTEPAIVGNNMLAPVITDFDCCPHCGGTFGYYTKVKSKISWHDNTCWDHKTKENTEMMDGCEDVWESVWIYCFECHKKICRRVSE